MLLHKGGEKFKHSRSINPKSEQSDFSPRRIRLHDISQNVSWMNSLKLMKDLHSNP